MTVPLSIRLDVEVRDTLEAEARREGIPLSTYLRQLAVTQAHALRRARIREESRLVGERAARDPVAAEFYREVGSPTAKI